MGYKHRKYPEWSWSQSRESIFKTCLRKYYFQYYKSHNGWEWNAPEENKEVYRLKKLQSTDTILGSSVHHLLHRVIHDGFPLEEKVLDKNIKKELNDAFRASQNRPAWKVNPSQHVMLKEIYYDEKLKDSKVEFINYKKDKIINYLINTNIVKNIKNSYYVKSFDTDTFETFDYNNTKVYAIPDLIYKNGKDKKPHIVDWKTGKEKNSNKEQLKLYAYYYYRNYDYRGEIKATFIYLYEQKMKEYIFDDKIIKVVEKKIDKSINEMKEYLQDEKWNQPLDQAEFKKRTNDVVCSYCKFRELCNR